MATAKTITKKPTRKVAGASKRITPAQRYQMINEAAFFLAEKDGFRPGHELHYWLQAEAMIVKRLS